MDCADELGVNHRDIARNAVAFVIPRGLSASYRRRWAKALLIALDLLVMVAFIPPWVLTRTVALGLLMWLIAAPGSKPKSPHPLL